MTPEQIVEQGKGSEHAHQVAFMAWLALQPKDTLVGELSNRIFAVPNGGSRSARVGAAMKAEGVRKGVPDMCLPVPRGGIRYHAWQEGDAPGEPDGRGGMRHAEAVVFHGLWIELKKEGLGNKPRGGASEEQVDWLDFLYKQGYAVCLAYGWVDARNKLLRYLDGKWTV